MRVMTCELFYYEDPGKLWRGNISEHYMFRETEIQLEISLLRVYLLSGIN